MMSIMLLVRGTKASRARALQNKEQKPGNEEERSRVD